MALETPIRAKGDRQVVDDDRDESAAALESDYRLALDCIAGKVAAWRQLHDECNPKLIRSVRAMLRSRSSDENLVEEIVARVWYALVLNDGGLLTRYTPQRGARLITFLRAIARDVMCRHFRSEQRREVRESRASSERPRHHCESLDQVDASLHEFCETLTGAEQQFCDDFLLNPPAEAGSEQGLSRANVWQKTHRLYVRFVRFFYS